MATRGSETVQDSKFLREVGISTQPPDVTALMELHNIELQRERTEHQRELAAKDALIAQFRALEDVAKDEIRHLDGKIGYLMLALVATALIAAWAVWRATYGC